MQYVKPDVSTICVGMAASGAALLLAAGAEKKRFALSNSEIMIHQVMAGGIEGQAVEIEISARHILRLKDRLNQILAKHSGNDLSKVEKDTDRDYYMTAEEAKKYGLIDEIIKRRNGK
ncbi:MAG: ATP-dependent Clp protease proteolytic subunit [Candidatus Adlerbacteria bacterium GW2011_GWC1_50_9]|uniref:ATP-dependent Clp protease proteolytic subunit n=1 Tax=Candidatus Adlerbacteria bacterium GW2011_GWC1_50_9 TaxID=1618608 RepID=A0A0G1ZJ70_9BACT|nr:MAG: ATP-dependent Clp protease proteolytic subunit [Candidatus Adlerbacteria bacterium GW2011_GWC1_50_9]